jgi:crotonobetainyl-CoA:carnitine CoA-transferase CaiB-like acyl-CoA transferase
VPSLGRKRAANSAALTTVLDEAFALQPLAHWREALDSARITDGVVRAPSDVVSDPQLLANEIIVPLESGGEHQHPRACSRRKAKAVA